MFAPLFSHKVCIARQSSGSHGKITQATVDLPPQLEISARKRYAEQSLTCYINATVLLADFEYSESSVVISGKLVTRQAKAT